MKIQKLTPHLAHPIWAGTRLASLKKLAVNDNIGETWEISRHPMGLSKLESGEELNLSEEKLPYLVKLIDTCDNLSVQVHPDDEYAERVEQSSGKTECWFILDAAPGAGIYLGLKEGTESKTFEEAVASGGDLTEFLNFYPVKRGDFYMVPAGSVHAIGKDVFLAEVQQSSGITYRVWDWNRVDHEGKSRELHIKKALDVINFESKKNSSDFFQMKRCLFDESGKEVRDIISHQDFSVELLECKDHNELNLTSINSRVIGILTLGNQMTINGQTVAPYSALIIHDEGKVQFEANELSHCLIIR